MGKTIDSEEESDAEDDEDEDEDADRLNGRAGSILLLTFLGNN